MTMESIRKWLSDRDGKDPARCNGRPPWLGKGPRSLSRQRESHQSWRCFQEEPIPKRLCQPP